MIKHRYIIVHNEDPSHAQDLIIDLFYEGYVVERETATENAVHYILRKEDEK